MELKIEFLNGGNGTLVYVQDNIFHHNYGTESDIVKIVDALSDIPIRFLSIYDRELEAREINTIEKYTTNILKIIKK